MSAACSVTGIVAAFVNDPDSGPVIAICGGVASVAAPAGHLDGQAQTLAEAMGELERRMIAESLRKHSGNISRAARELGLTRRGLYLKLERHSLKIANAG